MTDSIPRVLLLAWLKMLSSMHLSSHMKGYSLPKRSVRAVIYIARLLGEGGWGSQVMGDEEQVSR